MSLVEGDFAALGEWNVQTLMGMSLQTDEGQFKKAEEASTNFLMMKLCLDKLLESYQMACGVNPNQEHYEKNLKPQTNRQGGVYYPIFPILPKHKLDFFAGLQVEWWLDPHKVSSVEEAPEPFDMEALKEPNQDGVVLVLGAGNQSFLTLADVLDAMFVRQRTVLVKHHPLRGKALDPICRKLFRPLYEGGYLESCLDLQDKEATSALVYHPSVKAVHMTGGKATHDAIVWGSTPGEQETNKQNNTPKLQAAMTSELGCITPWIFTSATYTAKELQHHAEILVSGVHSNASSNCLAPKVVIMDENWSQREEFLQLLRKEWEKLDLPVAYYPGCKERWNKYKSNYPKASEWQGYNTDIQERKLSPPLLNNGEHGKEAVVLPLLCVDISVDLSTKAGREAARKEYAFHQEPFCPVLTFVTVQNSENAKYLESAVDLCNNYIYGSLSCSISVPKSCDESPEVETAIGNLQYGSVGVNVWTALCYVLGWGGHSHVERLDNVESGIGRIGNFLFIPHLLKTVVRGPSIWMAHPKTNRNYRQQKREQESVAALVQSPSVTTVLNLVATLLRLPQTPEISSIVGKTVHTGLGIVSTLIDGFKNTLGFAVLKDK